MALYSVWDWDRNTWAVYRDARPVSVGDDPTPPRPASVGPLGADPDTQMKPLPSDARFVGYDHMCRGEVRVKSSGPLSGLGIDMPDTDDLKKYLAGAALGALGVWFWRRR
jgi:hypothetical protein